MYSTHLLTGKKSHSGCKHTMSLGPVLLFLCLTKVSQTPRLFVAMGKLRHSLLMQYLRGCSACVPGKRDSQQCWDKLWDREAHSIPVPTPWGDGVLGAAPAPCSMLLCTSSQRSALQGLQAPETRVSALPGALPVEGTILLASVQNYQQFGRGWAKHELCGSWRDADKSSAVYHRDKFHLRLIQG